MEEQQSQKNRTENVKEYKFDENGKFAPGTAGGGRAKGMTMKEYARFWFLLKDEEEKKKYIEQVERKRPGFSWEMAEGKAKQENEIKGTLTISDVLDQLDGQKTSGQNLAAEPFVQDQEQSGAVDTVQAE